MEVEKDNSKLEQEDNYTPKSMTRIIWEQFVEHKFAVVSCYIILFFVFLGLAAPLVSAVTGLHPDVQDVFNRYKPPMTEIPFPEDRQEFELEKLSYQNSEMVAKMKAAIKASSELSELEFEMDLDGEEFLISLNEYINEEADIVASLKTANKAEFNQFLKAKSNFKTFHVLGTDELGRDVLIRLIYGTRVSIGVGIAVALAAALIGLFIGCVAGFYGGVVDTILMRFTDALLSLPLFPVLIIFAAIDLKKVPVLGGVIGGDHESVFKLFFILCLFSWMTVARLIRGGVLALKEQEFIQAAKTLGAKDFSIITSHIVPNVVAPLLVAVTLNVSSSILTEAALSFLGLGIQPPTPSWGNMLFNAQELIYEAPLLAIIPGILILIVVISFNFLGDGLQDAIDPKGIKR
jgi:peptide/nickel transport system permease protein